MWAALVWRWGLPTDVRHEYEERRRILIFPIDNIFAFKDLEYTIVLVVHVGGLVDCSVWPGQWVHRH